LRPGDSGERSCTDSTDQGDGGNGNSGVSDGDRAAGGTPAPETVTERFSVVPSTGAVGVITNCVAEAAWVTVIDPAAELADRY
jgi:hypothetical protein